MITTEMKERLIGMYNERIDEYRHYAPTRKTDAHADKHCTIAFVAISSIEETAKLFGARLVKRIDDSDSQLPAYAEDAVSVTLPQAFATAEERLAAGFDHAAEYRCNECGLTFWDEFRSNYRLHETVCPHCGTNDPLFVQPTGKIVNKSYTVLPEYRDLWSSDPSWDGTTTMAEIQRLSREWGKPVEELMGQVEE